MSYPMLVEDIYNKKIHRKKLKSLGLSDLGCGRYAGDIRSASQVKRIEEYCDKNYLKHNIQNSFGTRSTGYRHIYFKNNKPHLWGKYYFCAYCGKIMSRRKMTIDHLYPISRASWSVGLQKKLKQKGFTDIDDPKNLVAACKNCNRKKGYKMGKWLFKGRIGRNPAYWKFRWILRILLTIAVVVFIVAAVTGQIDLKNVVSTITSKCQQGIGMITNWIQQKKYFLKIFRA